MTPLNATKLGAVLLLISLIMVPMTTMASHNSFGAHAHILQADEFDRNSGALTPDIPHDSSPYVQYFHEILVEDGLQAREAPPDQTGDRYTDCKPYGEYDSDDDAYRADLLNGDACYVGYLDHQVEYLVVASPLVTKAPIDLLYPYNPDPSDDHCNGREDPQDPLEDNGLPGDAPQPVDEVYTRVLRSNEGGKCGPISGEHTWFLPPGESAIDPQLLEAGAMAAAEAVGTDTGSGTLSMGYAGTTYAFLFGQPHPSNDAPSSFAAGQGVFGPNPATGGNPLIDMTGACGDRTKECRLLTPEDIKAYDPEPQGADELARVCAFQPQYTYSVIGDDGSVDRDKGLCGNVGNVMDQFIDDISKGGFGLPGAPDTWSTNLPGWYWGVLYLASQWTQDNNEAFVDDYSTEEKEFRDGWIHYIAVNPSVPTIEGPLNCITPNFMSEPEHSVMPSGFEDPGLFGGYIADAIDADVYVPPLLTPKRNVRDQTHDTLQPIVAPVDAVVDQLTVENVQSLAESTINGLPLPPEVEAALDKADYLESNDPETHAQLGSDNARSFSQFQEKGLRCDSLRVLRLYEEGITIPGGTRFVVNLQQRSVQGNELAIKDPTLLGSDGLPAGESETTRGAWMTDSYSFGGNIHGVFDTNGNGELDSCATPNGLVQPDADFCAWKGLWDAYGGGCSAFSGTPCSAILNQTGYDVNASGDQSDGTAPNGVGLYFVAKVTGPVAVVDEDQTTQITNRNQVVGAGNALAQNCIVGVTAGFDQFLPGILDALSTDTITTMDQAEAHLCQGADGQTTTVLDAFDDQSGDTPGGFSAAVNIVKLAPTPDAAVDTTGLGATDELCVVGTWNVRSDWTGSTEDTAGNLDLTAAGTNVGVPGMYQFEDCDSLVSTTQ